MRIDISNPEMIAKLKDKKFYLENFCKIKGKKPGSLIPFLLNEAQKDLFNAVRTNNRVIILKARQIGFSTAMTGYFYVDTILNPGTTTALIGYNSDLTAELLDKVKTFYRTTPAELRPTVHYNSKYEVSFPKIDSKILVLPSTVNVGRGYTITNCLKGNTKIIMYDGSSKKIKEINEGDIVTNGNGGPSTVRGLVKKFDNEKRMLKIKVAGSENIELTEEHKILTRKKVSGKESWEEAKNISDNDYIAFPYRQCRNRRKFFKLDCSKKDGYEKRGVIPTSRKIIISKEFGEFCGWFLAEGSVSDGRISLSIHKKEVKEVLAVVNCIREYVGKISVSYSKKSLTAVIQIYGKDMATFMKNMFGNGCQNKKLPIEVWNCGYEFNFGLLKGYINGDGYTRKKDRIIMTSVSEKLLNGIKMMLVSLRIGLPYIYESESYRYGVKSLNRFDLHLGGKGNYKLRRKLGYSLPIYNNARAIWRLNNHPEHNQGHGYWRRGKFHYWVKVLSVEEVERSKTVYDIALAEEPHSFLTNIGVVHNCLATELSSWDDAEEKMMTLEASVPIDGTLVIESTPKGQGNLYHKMWMSDNDYVKKEYGWWWGYSQNEIDTIRKRMNNPQKFAQEYGLEFLASGRPVFDARSIKDQRKNVWALDDEIDTSTNTKIIKDILGKVISNHDYNVLRAGGLIRIIKDDDKLVMYHEPEDGHFYIVGVDTSEGVEGGDYSVATIWDRATGEEVANFRGLLPPDILANKLNKWGRKYNNALMVVEVNNHGLTVLTVLKNLLYPSIYFRPSKFETIASASSDKMGWKTTRVTRLILIDDFAQSIRESELTIHTKELLDEMTVFVYNDAGEMVPQGGFHDDCIFSAAVGYQGFKVMYDKPLTQLNYVNHLPRNFSY